MRSRRVVPLTLVALLTLLLPSPALAGAGEEPYNQDCEVVVVIVVLCAGADAGTNGGCDDENQPQTSCWYTYGWNLLAKSPAQLPGGGRLDWSYEIEVCHDATGCRIIDADAGSLECAWTLRAAEPCAAQFVGEENLDFELALGECVVVTPFVTVSAEAWAPSESGPLFAAAASDDSTRGGAACYVDNGR